MSAQTLNPLQKLVVAAVSLRHCWEEETSSLSDVGEGSWLRFPQYSVAEDLPKYRGRTIYPSLEQAGTAGLYSWLLEQEYDVLFANDLAYTIHGIDAIAYDTRRAVFIVCEAKGTGNAFKPPRHYLLDTQKGLQLSWEWCWRSIVEFAGFGPTAHAFLEVYEAMIVQENIERLLAVTQADAARRGFQIHETRVWREKELCDIERLCNQKNWTKYRRWLNELETGQKRLSRTKKCRR